MKRVWIALVKFFGWRFELPNPGVRPEVMRCVYVEAPHTSVFDFVIGIAFMWQLGVPGHIFIKKEFFRWPLGGLLRRYGCVSIDRGNPRNGLVARAVEGFATHGDYAVILTPEATRKPVRRWKRGFWEIATQADVPVVPVCIDYSRRVMSLLPTYRPTADYEADVRHLRSLYRKEMARHPEKYIE